jgi:hypothetical protein
MNILRYYKTDTTKFILPLLFNDNTKHTNILTNDFKNAYIADIDDPSKDDYILVEFADSGSNPLTNNTESNLEETYIKDDSIIYAYSIPDKFIEDYYKFLSGKYSEFSEQAKKHILNFWGEDDKSPLYRVLYGNSENWPSPNVKKEILGYEIVYKQQIEFEE